MVALDEHGSGSSSNRIDIRGEEIVRKYQDYASDEGVFDDLFACLRRNLNAKKSQRVESDAREAGYSYETVEDPIAQIAAARTLAQILRLMPQSAGVTVHNGAQQTIHVTAVERLAELDAIGVPREDIAQACTDLLTASQAARPTTNASLPAKDLQQSGF